jgi:uncharacterized protein (UPF0147 family)
MDFEQAISGLEMLKEEIGIPKNLKAKINLIIEILDNDSEDPDVRANKSAAILDEISCDTSLQSFVRTQLYQIISFL